MNNLESNSWKREYIKGFIVVFFGLSFSIFAFFVGYLGWFNDLNYAPESWFQYCGVIMLAFLLFVDYWIYKMANSVNDLEFCPPYAVEIKDAFRPFVKIFQPIAFIFTLLATLISGLGQIIFPLFN